MVRLACRLWQGDLRRFLGAGLIIFLAGLMYSGALNALRSIEATMYAPARRLLGGDLAVVLSGCQVLASHTRENGLWTRLTGNALPYAESRLPTDGFRFARYLVLPGFLLLDGQEVRIALFGRDGRFNTAPLAPVMVAGRPFSASDANQRVALVAEGWDVGKRYGLQPGSWIKLKVPRYTLRGDGLTAEAWTTVDVQVIGLYRDTMIAGASILVPLETFREELTDLGGLVTVAGTLVRSSADLSERELALSRLLPDGLKVVSARSVLEGLTGEPDGIRRTAYVMSWLVVIVSLVSVVSSAFYLVSLRRRELALLLALGVTPLGLVLMTAAEIAVLAGGASFLGTLCSVVLPGGSSFAWRPGLIFVASVTLLAGVAGLLPTLHLSRISPTEVIRNE
jgi:hypothetical protein